MEEGRRGERGMTEWNLFSSRFMYCLTGIGWTKAIGDATSAARLTVRLLLIQRAKNKRFVVCPTVRHRVFSGRSRSLSAWKIMRGALCGLKFWPNRCHCLVKRLFIELSARCDKFSATLDFGEARSSSGRQDRPLSVDRASNLVFPHWQGFSV